MAEIGYAINQRFDPLEDDNWELRWPHSVKVFAKMGREDAQVKSVLNAVSLPIRRATWRLDPNGAPAEIIAHVSEDLRLPVLGEDSNKPIAPRLGRVSWSEHLQKVLLSLQFGHMFFEQVYAPGADGREHLVKLAPRMPGTIDKINVAIDGGLVSIRQKPIHVDSRSIDPDAIPVNKLVAYVFEPLDSSWRGTSILRPAYKHWKLRDDLLRLEVSTLDRNGMGVPMYIGSELADDPESDLARGENLARAFRSGKTAGGAIPAKAEFKLLGVSGQIVSPREAINYHDSMMAKSVLAHFLNLEGKGGSYALAETQSDLFIQSLQTTAEWIADTATQYVVEDLVNIAFEGYSGLMPRVVFDPIASKKDLTAEALSVLTNSKVILPDRDLEEDVRRRYSLPGKRSLVETKAANPDLEKPKADEIATLAKAAAVLVSAGVNAEGAFRTVGLDPTLITSEGGNV